jgi:hypothetical protein
MRWRGGYLPSRQQAVALGHACRGESAEMAVATTARDRPLQIGRLAAMGEARRVLAIGESGLGCR